MSARPVPARKHSAVWYLFAAVLGWAVVLSLFANTLHPAVLRRDAARAPPAERGFGDACRQLPDLGFNYPPLRPVRRMLEALACEPPVSRSVVAAAYRAALLQVDPGAPVNPAAAPLAPMGAAGPSQGRAGAGAGDSAAASTADGSSAAAHLQRFLSLALAHVAADGHVLACALDPSLLEAALGSSSGGGGGGSASSKRVLFAANLSNSGVLAPNLIVQLLRLALLLPPGQLGVSIYESGSSDLTRQWLSLLRMLLLPLGVPHNVTLGGALRPQAGGARVEFLAALRNAALEPFLPHAVPAAAHNAAWPEAGAEGASDTEGSAGGGEWLPEVVVFANDVFFCAGDALRLLTHDADLACGLDFYTGAWQLQGAGGGGSDGSGGGGRGGGDAEAGAVEEDEDDVTLLHQLGEREQGASSDGDGDGSAAAPGRRRAARRLRLARRLATREARLQAREEALGEDSMRQGVLAQRRAARQLQQEEGPAKGQLRFYDKWVARDVSGARLRNLPPYVAHGPSRARLLAGLPFPAACCWDGLAALRAAPLLSPPGLRFRAQLPGECRASECSLLCDDLHRLGRGRIVIDPGVRVAYEWDQALQLAAIASGSGGSGAQPDSSQSGGAPGRAAAPLAPPLSWREASAAGMPAAAAPSAGGGYGDWALRLDRVDCCDLAPGKAYVNFRRDCHPVDVLSTNFTQQFLTARRGGGGAPGAA